VVVHPLPGPAPAESPTVPVEAPAVLNEDSPDADAAATPTEPDSIPHNAGLKVAVVLIGALVVVVGLIAIVAAVITATSQPGPPAVAQTHRQSAQPPREKSQAAPPREKSRAGQSQATAGQGGIPLLAGILVSAIGFTIVFVVVLFAVVRAVNPRSGAAVEAPSWYAPYVRALGRRRRSPAAWIFGTSRYSGSTAHANHNGTAFDPADTDWRALRDEAFELFLKDAFEHLGYTVRLTSAKGAGTQGDRGADLVVGGRGHRFAVQAKGYPSGSTVGVTAVGDALRGMMIYGCDRCAVITNSRLTGPAIKDANAVGCLVIECEDLSWFVRGQHPEFPRLTDRQ
jgi:hypothetical protein